MLSFEFISPSACLFQYNKERKEKKRNSVHSKKNFLTLVIENVKSAVGTKGKCYNFNFRPIDKVILDSCERRHFKVACTVFFIRGGELGSVLIASLGSKSSPKFVAGGSQVGVVALRGETTKASQQGVSFLMRRCGANDNIIEFHTMIIGFDRAVVSEHTSDWVIRNTLNPKSLGSRRMSTKRFRDREENHQKKKTSQNHFGIGR